jgi:hypothetical protein
MHDLCEVSLMLLSIGADDADVVRVDNTVVVGT